MEADRTGTEHLRASTLLYRLIILSLRLRTLSCSRRKAAALVLCSRGSSQSFPKRRMEAAVRLPSVQISLFHTMCLLCMLKIILICRLHPLENTNCFNSTRAAGGAKRKMPIKFSAADRSSTKLMLSSAETKWLQPTSVTERELSVRFTLIYNSHCTSQQLIIDCIQYRNL